MGLQAPPPPLPPPKTVVRQVIEAPPTTPALPALANSDSFMLDALSGLVDDKSLMKLFNAEKIIHNIVATIINLNDSRAPMSVMPVKPAPGTFGTERIGGGLIISPKNATRYAPYVRIAEVINSKKLVELYIRVYPLFQRAYEQLGYPNKYFNDLLIQTLDNLLDTPTIKEPVKLVQPNVLYLFADPDLEEQSSGRKILMRTGSRNEAIIKSKLREIRRIASPHA